MMGSNMGSKTTFLSVIIRKILVASFCILGAAEIAIGASMPSRVSNLTPAQRAILFRGINSNLGKMPTTASRPVYQSPYSGWRRVVAPRFTGSTPSITPNPAIDTASTATSTMSDLERQKLKEAGIKAEQERREKIERSGLPDWLANTIYRPTQAEVDWKVLRTPAEEAQQNREALQEARRTGWQKSQQEREDRIAAARVRAAEQEDEDVYGQQIQRINAKEWKTAAALQRESQKKAGIRAAEERRKNIEQSWLPDWAANIRYRPTQAELDWRVLRTNEEARKEARESDWKAAAQAREERIRAAQDRGRKQEAQAEQGLISQRMRAQEAARTADLNRKIGEVAGRRAERERLEAIGKSRLPERAANWLYRPSQQEIDWRVTRQEQEEE